MNSGVPSQFAKSNAGILLSQTVDRAASSDPGRVAFSDGRVQYSYAELAEESSRLARLLMDHGVQPGDNVGIRMPRCIESALAVYGVLKAGAVFVPVDPFAPTPCAAELLQNCGIRHLISHKVSDASVQEIAERTQGLETVLGCQEGLPSRVCGLPWNAQASYSATNPEVGRSVDDPAYIMFSSGSTGRSKGIVHTHRSGLAYAELSAETYGLVAEDRIANHSPLHFDMSTLGYLTAPYVGATTVIVPEAYTKMAASLSTLIEKQQVTVWYSVPLALIQLLTRGVLEKRNLESLRWVLFGGEPFPVRHLRDLMTAWPSARFSNVYGPAEVNQCTYYHVPPLAEDRVAPIPIGALWSGAEGMVVDERGREVEEGQAGELLVSTATMMLGYWGQPEKDDEVFHRPEGEEGPIFYRTGDLVRRMPGDEMLFLGRRDRQLKVRGYRVELDDIEHVLCLHPGVREVGVYPTSTEEGYRIEAAVIAAGNPGPPVEEIRALAAEKLMWYSVPARFEIVEDLPRTTSGKIDRRRLQSLAEARL